MSALRKVSVAILSWQGRDHLATCLRALEAQQDPGVAWEVLVLDNGSTDGTADFVRQHHPDVRLVHSAVNLGFCAGMNRLVAEAAGEAVALLNNDTRPQPGWLGSLVEALASAPGDVAAVSGQIVDWQGERLDFAQGALTFDGHAFQLGYGRPLAEVEIPAAGSELMFACGGNMLVWKQAFLEAGGFDPDYFAYLEDVDLGWRLWAGGQRVLFAPGALVHHRSMATSDLLGQDHRGFLFERNAFLTAYKNYESGLWERMLPAVLLTLQHRTQTLLVQNNPGGEQLTFDPYAGLIANTPRTESCEDPGEPQPASAAADPAPRSPSLYRKWRDWGTRELLRRALAKGARMLGPNGNDAGLAPALTDGRSVAQLRALTYLLGNLDSAAEKRQRVQARRCRPDAEIFERFPPYLVPTYPGDERLFASPGFADWLPAELPLVRRQLDEIMVLRR